MALASHSFRPSPTSAVVPLCVHFHTLSLTHAHSPLWLCLCVWCARVPNASHRHCHYRGHYAQRRGQGFHGTSATHFCCAVCMCLSCSFSTCLLCLDTPLVIPTHASLLLFAHRLCYIRAVDAHYTCPVSSLQSVDMHFVCVCVCVCVQLYVLSVATAKCAWQIHRRYREFDALWKQVRASAMLIPTPPFVCIIASSSMLTCVCVSSESIMRSVSAAE